ncbi:MAG: hypothetical protein AAFZ58_14950 [Pseudomonadota bacterium]
MSLDLAAVLPALLPKAIAWAEHRSAEILKNGVELSARESTLAVAVGVKAPERIRIQSVAAIPVPEDAELASVARASGLLGAGTIGLTLGYGIYVCDGHRSTRLISHECRHVYQYEMAGSIGDFLPVYLQQIVDFGYVDAPYEIDARQHEITAQ